jgi:hypothetical protein
MKIFYYFVSLTMLFSCAQMKKNWIAENCNEGSAYSAGVADAQNGMNHNSTSFGMCNQDQIGPLKKEYSKGYNSVQKQETKVVVKEIHHGRPHSSSVVTKTRPSTSTNFFECSVSAYDNTFVSTHQYEKTARREALAKCESKYNLLNCKSTGCRVISTNSPDYKNQDQKKYHCRIRAYSNTFTGIDYNLGKARYHAISKCKRVYNESHCKNPSCSQEI